MWNLFKINLRHENSKENGSQDCIFQKNRKSFHENPINLLIDLYSEDLSFLREDLIEIWEAQCKHVFKIIFRPEKSVRKRRYNEDLKVEEVKLL